MKVKNHTGPWDATLAWYSASATCRIWLIVEILATQRKSLEPSDYCTAINCAFTFLISNVFGCFCSISFQVRLQLSSHTQRISAPTTTILPTIVGTLHGLNFFVHLIYIQQTSTYENIGKLLTHPSNNKWHNSQNSINKQINK